MERVKGEPFGVIGLGIIGSRVVRMLRDGGRKVYVWNRSPRSEADFVASPGEMARLTNRIQIFVSDGKALLEVVEQLAPELSESHVVVCSCTADPESVVEAYQLTRERGAGFLDAPFSGTREDAETGGLVYFVGGDASALDRSRELLEPTSSEIVPVGRIGEATVLNIAGSMISAATVEILAESLGLLQAAGISPERLDRVLASSGCGSDLARSKLGLMAEADFSPRHSLENVFKDAQYALGLAKGLGVELPVLATTANVLYRTMKKGHSERDCAVVAERFSAAGTATNENGS